MNFLYKEQKSLFTYCLSLFSLKSIKNKFYITIHIFKNYFTILILVSNFPTFSFNNNKFNPNVLLIKKKGRNDCFSDENPLYHGQ